jgi:hypothetical protein
MKRHLPKLLAASLAFVIGVVASGNAAYQIGCLHAYINLARGQHQLHIFGTIDGDVEEFSEIATNDYGIEIVTHGCIISEQGIEQIRGYNDTSLAAIKRKYGAGVIDSIWERAQRRYRAKHSVH